MAAFLGHFELRDQCAARRALSPHQRLIRPAVADEVTARMYQIGETVSTKREWMSCALAGILRWVQQKADERRPRSPSVCKDPNSGMVGAKF